MAGESTKFSDAVLTIRTEDGETVTAGELKSVSIELQDIECEYAPNGTRWKWTEDW